MMKRTFFVLLLLTTGCDHPGSDLVLNCQRACAPREVKRWTWDGWSHSATCECATAPESR